MTMKGPPGPRPEPRERSTGKELLPCYTEGIGFDGPVILKDGELMTISDLLADLNSGNDYIENIAEHHRLHQELNLILHPAGDGPEKPSLCDLVAYVRKDLSGLAKHEKKFPMQDGPDIPWSLAEEIYLVYSELYGTDQSLQKIAERRGFGWSEIPHFMELKKKRDRR